jgi:integrase
MDLQTLFRSEYSPLRRLGQKSINCYEVTLRHFDRHLAKVADRPTGPAKVADLTDLTVARFLAERERATCRATAGRDRCQLLALWRYAARKRMPGANGQPVEFPEVPIMRAPSRAVIAYTSAEIERLIRTAREGLAQDHRKAGATGGVPPAEWWASLILVLWESGERITAVMSTRWRDVDVGGRRVLFRAETRKFQKGDLDRRISPVAAEWLAGRVASPSEAVWPWRRNASVLWTHFRSLCRRAGVPYRGFHAIRRSTVSYCEAAEKGAGQRAADHESGTTTKRSYLDPRIVNDGTQPVDLLPPLNLETQPPQPEGDG